ncbi:ATP-binding protein [Agromyces atrinae]|uniref:ATP-binding protein n=1 Tax=Agromyces atrinae TaxID=592376 RepID=UPI001F5AF286|nr:ATP-binding protein [Agromyces atrinae]MCI2956857.1 ATP-binding protein [Agromyces atrinae]
MILDALPDIPRWYTALAEWGACLVYVSLLKRRRGLVGTGLVLAAGLLVLLVVQSVAATLPIELWTAGMSLAIMVMFGIIFACVSAPPLTAGYLLARALVLAELVASLQWQLHSFVFSHSQPTPAALLLLFVVYAASFAGAGFAEARHFTRNETLLVGGKEVVTAVAIALTTFAVSNLSFLSANTPFSARAGMELFYIRTLVDFAGYIALYMQQEHHRELHLREENAAVHALLRSQHEQYLLTRRSIDALNRMHHDMKHHLVALRGESDPARKDAYIDELEESIRGYGDRVQTGNSVLDTVLTAKRMYAAENGVTLTCVADGRLLDFMSVIDICTVVGNALDNAIESTLRVSDSEQRTVRLATFAQDDFVMLRIENSFDGVVNRRNGRLETRKADPDRHGYGLRNIEAAVEKYGGNVSISVEGTWFSLRALLPR